ncbi:stage III sporulation protein AE [Clostridium sp. 'deep sea']|uniref:stage III sporulation protein AE n=1 Tax=Clostridium sp. 'deep sea' TaxID=2779445 RepID=UPI0018969F25|nr:stage III sporulation protein AE [Clostridium sp. 'deep sea']QOR35855.1 stage III sporulation protein AE [Clostridium sp. 'deep sea']
MKNKIFTLFLFVIVLININIVYAEEDFNAEDVIRSQFEKIDFSDINVEMQKINEKYKLPELSPQSIWEMFKGGNEASFNSVIETIKNYFFKEIKQQLLVFTRIFILTLLAVLIIKIQEAFNSKVSDIVFKIIYLTLMAFIIQSLSIGLKTAADAINYMINFMLVLWPVLITLMVSLGHVVSSTLFDPLLVGGSQFVSQAINFTVLPLFFTSGILQVVDYLSEEISISKLAKLVRNFGAFILGICFTVFSGITILRGTAGSVADGVALRTGKFLTKGFLPVIGSMLSDAFDTILGCTLVVKNAVGIFGLLTLFFICTLPALKLIVMIFMYKIAGAFLQPIDNNRISPLMFSVSGVLTYIMAAILAVGVMLFITLTIILISGNATVMFR